MEYILILKRLCTLNPQDQKFLTTATGVPFKGDGGRRESGGKGRKREGRREKGGEEGGEEGGEGEITPHLTCQLWFQGTRKQISPTFLPIHLDWFFFL